MSTSASGGNTSSKMKKSFVLGVYVSLRRQNITKNYEKLCVRCLRQPPAAKHFTPKAYVKKFLHSRQGTLSFLCFFTIWSTHFSIMMNIPTRVPYQNSRKFIKIHQNIVNDSKECLISKNRQKFQTNSHLRK